MAPKVSQDKSAPTLYYKPLCSCSTLAGSHFAEACQRVKRMQRSGQSTQKVKTDSTQKVKTEEEVLTQSERQASYERHLTSQKDLRAAHQAFKAQQGDKPLFTFTADEWKELQKVKKLLRQIKDIKEKQERGEKLDCLQQEKLGREESLTNSLVMVKERAGAVRPTLVDKVAASAEEASTVASVGEDDWEAPVG